MSSIRSSLARSPASARTLPLAPIVRRVAPSSSVFLSFQRCPPSFRSYSTKKDETPAPAAEESTVDGESAKLVEFEKQIEEKDKLIAELRDARLRSLADFENLQKISTREKAQAKDFALTSFARDLISSIDILSMALNSIPEHKIVLGHADAPKDHQINPDLVSLHQGVSLTKLEIEKVLKRHGVVPFNPVGEQFDPNLHEALYQAPVPGKAPGSVLECQEIGYMIKDRLLRPAKVGVVLSE